MRLFTLITGVFALPLLSLTAFAHSLENQRVNCKHHHADYLGNEGIMVSTGQQKVLFDAFYTDSYEQYALVPGQTQKALLAGTPPWDNIDALFISHAHGDHFAPAPTLAYLRAHTDVQVYASNQVIKRLESGIAKERLHRITLEAGDSPVTINQNGLIIDAVRIPHAGGSQTANIENLAFRVNFTDGFTVLHLGDADPDISHFSQHSDHWNALTLETAFPPYWFMDNDAGQIILNDYLKPEQVIGIHVPLIASENPQDWKSRYKGDLFTTPGEIRGLGNSACDTEPE